MNKTPGVMLGMLLISCTVPLLVNATVQFDTAPSDTRRSDTGPALTIGEQTMTVSGNTDQQKTKQQWFQQIKQLVGTAAADEVGQCRVAPLGHKPCGGPASYLVYSVRDLDEPALLAAITQYTKLDQAQQQALGLVSDCAIVPKPAVALHNGVCVAIPAHGSAQHLTE